MQVKLGYISARTALSNSRIYGVRYALNPFVGCLHGCAYCYARFIRKQYGIEDEWGSFLYVKRDFARLLTKDLAKRKPGVTLVSSTTDPYQPLGKLSEVSRRCLELLLKSGFPVVLMTKNAGVLRDADLLSQYRSVEVGFSFFTYDDSDARNFELRTSPPKDRVRALEEMRKLGIRTFAFIAPFIPIVSERTIEELLENVLPIVDEVYLDKLNIKAGNWRSIKRVLEEKYPEELRAIKRILFNEVLSKRYYEELKEKLNRYDIKYVY